MTPPAPDTFSVVDYVVIGALVLSSGIGFMRGLTREALGLCSWIGALWGTTLLEPTLRPLLSSYVHHPTALSVCSVGGGFLALLLVGALISRGIVSVIQKSALSSIDRTLGLPFGFARGYLVVSCALLIYAMFSDSVLHSAVERSKLFPFIQQGSLWIHSFLDKMPDSLQILPADRGTAGILKGSIAQPQHEKLEDFIAPRLKQPEKQEETLDTLIQAS